MAPTHRACALVSVIDSPPRTNLSDDHLHHGLLRLCLALVLLLLVVAISPVGEWLLVPLENRFPPAHPIHVDGILLLAEDEQPQITEMRGQPVTYVSASNYLVFASLVRAWPNAKLAFSGGPGTLLS